MALRSPLTVQPYDYISDSTGRPLDKGQIYIGVAGQDPEFYQIPVYLDAAMTKPIDQPIRTNDGFVDFAGSLSELYASSEVYSVKVLDKQGRKVIYKAEMMRNNLTDDALSSLNRAIVAVTRGAESSVKEAIDALVIDEAVTDSFVAVRPQYLGAVARSQAQKNGETASIEDFYKTSWSQALTDALLSSASTIIIPDNGTYVFDSPVEVIVNNKIIIGNGLITANTKIPRLLKLTGDNNQISINVDGNNLIENCMSLIGNNVKANGNIIKNLYADGANSAVAIYITSDGYFEANGNTIKNLYAVGDNKNGNGVGMSRAVAISRSNSIATARGFVKYNIIDDCYGEEGDSITIHSTNGGLGNIEVAHNEISGWSRRAIKVQAFNVDVTNNTLKNIEHADITYNLSGTISIIEGGSSKVSANTIEDFDASSINLNLTSTDTAIQQKYKDIQIHGNTLTKIDNSTPSHIFVSSTAFKNLSIVSNTFNAGIGIVIALDGRIGYTVVDNIFNVLDSTNPVVRITSDIDGSFVFISNKLYTGIRPALLNMYNSPSCVTTIKNNVIINSTPLFVADRSRTRKNTIGGNTASVILGNSNARINTVLLENTQDSVSDAVDVICYCDIIPSSSVRMGSLEVKKGTMVKNTGSNQPNFWYATTDGLASDVVWEELYLLKRAEVLKLRSLM